jgi:hypothetical protein
VYLVALLGLAIFYGLERMVKSSQKRGALPATGKELSTPSMGIFWLHILSFGVYNTLIGYLLVHREEQDVRGLLFFFVALALHFLINDYGLRQDRKDTYERLGRWIVSAAILIGWIAGLATQINQATTDILFCLPGRRDHPERVEGGASRGKAQPVFRICTGRNCQCPSPLTPVAFWNIGVRSFPVKPAISFAKGVIIMHEHSPGPRKSNE